MRKHYFIEVVCDECRERIPLTFQGRTSSHPVKGRRGANAPRCPGGNRTPTESQIQEAEALRATQLAEQEREEQRATIRQKIDEAKRARERALQRIDTAERYLKIAVTLFESADQALDALEELAEIKGW